MNRKQFLVLVLALVVLGGAGLAVFWQDIAAYRESGARIGAKLLPHLKVADVAQIRLQNAHSHVTIAKHDNGWVVEERGGYPADVQAISGLIVKLIELKVTQAETVGVSLLPRVDLMSPAQGATAAAAGVGTLIEFKDKNGKEMARLVLGKKVLKKDPLNPLPSAQNGVPAGRYVLVSSTRDNVAVVSDPLNAAEAEPGKWLAKDFFKADRIKTLTVEPESAAQQWKVTRSEEWGQWKLAGAGKLDASKAVAAVNALGGLSFSDVAVKPEEAAKPTVVTADTFDGLVYRVKIAPQKSGPDYDVSFAVSGEPPRQRVPEKGEKPEDKARRDKDFAEQRKKLEARIAREKALGKWTYIVKKSEVAPLLMARHEMMAQKSGK